MNTAQGRPTNAPGRRAEAIVARHLQALFHRFPMLCGFSLQQDLELRDVTICTWPGCGASGGLREDLMLALADLVEERPDATELLRGRTFARSLH